MHLIKSSIGIWLALILLTLPFPYYLFGSFAHTSSDSEILYWNVLWILPLSLAISILSFRLENKVKIDSLLRVIIAYVLSFFLLKYGVDKILLQQFYTPKSNILFTPIGQLTKDSLYWTSMGTSKSYNWFMGIIELIPAILLLHSKTRELGAIIAFGVLLNVFMVNVGFDISVKLLSLYLLICSTYLFQPSLMETVRFFVLKQQVQLNNPVQPLSTSPTLKRTLKSFVISIFILEICLPYLNQAPKNKLIGAYNLGSPTLLLGQNTKRIYIHSEDYFIIENTDGAFSDFKCSITGNYIHLLDENLGFQINQKQSITEFKSIGKNDKNTITTTKINLNQLPLMQDDFNWTVEGIIKNQVSR